MEFLLITATMATSNMSVAFILNEIRHREILVSLIVHPFNKYFTIEPNTYKLLNVFPTSGRERYTQTFMMPQIFTKEIMCKNVDRKENGEAKQWFIKLC